MLSSYNISVDRQFLILLSNPPQLLLGLGQLIAEPLTLSQLPALFPLDPAIPFLELFSHLPNFKLHRRHNLFKLAKPVKFVGDVFVAFE